MMVTTIAVLFALAGFLFCAAGSLTLRKSAEVSKDATAELLRADRLSKKAHKLLDAYQAQVIFNKPAIHVALLERKESENAALVTATIEDMIMQYGHEKSRRAYECLRLIGIMSDMHGAGAVTAALGTLEDLARNISVAEIEGGE